MSDLRADLDHWKKLDTPEALFMELWAGASQASPSDLTSTVVLPSASLAAALTADVGKKALGAICLEIEKLLCGAAASAVLATILAAMQAIDAAMRPVHPAEALLPAPMRSPLPKWVANAAETRSLDGVYWSIGGRWLVPRGPFSRAARARTAASAETFRERFRALSVVPASTCQDVRAIALKMTRISLATDRGVPLGTSAKPGAERVGFVPVAEGPGDLLRTVSNGGPSQMLDIRSAPTFDGGGRLLAALAAIGEADIAVAPELTIGQRCEQRLRSGLQASSSGFPRLLLAGSGLVEAPGAAAAFNEARVLNAKGAVLWRQRKVWPFGMQRTRAEGYRLVNPGGSELLMEKIEAGDEIVVADVDGLGRCVVLICQDFQCTRAVEDIIDDYQPDWVFVPVLDPGIRAGGWAHSRAFELSGRSQARFIVSSSLTMCHWGLASGDSAPTPPFGLAVGPKDPTDPDPNNCKGDMGRAVAFAESAAGASPAHAVLTWRSGTGNWRKTALCVE